MHDWTLLSLQMNWESGEVLILVRGPGVESEIRGLDVQEFHVHRVMPWGPSISINGVVGPVVDDDGLSRLAIEMQSGDLIEIVARSFTMPSAVKNSD
jgi:hypothetical protein